MPPRWSSAHFLPTRRFRAGLVVCRPAGLTKNKGRPMVAALIEKNLFSCLAGDFLQLLLIDVEVRIDVLYVVLVFNGFQKADHLAGSRAL